MKLLFNNDYEWIVVFQNFNQYDFRLNKQHCILLFNVYMRALINWRSRILVHRDYWASIDAQWSNDSNDASIESIECDYVMLFQFLNLSIKTISCVCYVRKHRLDRIMIA